jgi:hypothetical protein
LLLWVLWALFNASYLAVGPEKDKVSKTLAHPDYHLIQSWWHPTENQGKQPADFTHGSNKAVWLRCPGYKHGCGRHHEWKATPANLTSKGGKIICPSCESRGRSFCECQSVASVPRQETGPNS